MRLSACILLLRYRNDATIPHFYLVQRSPKLRFLGGFHALPGGTTDRLDHQRAEISPYHFKDSPQRLAAIRELFEETGVLLVTPAPKLSAQALTEFRTRCIEEPTHFFEKLDSLGLSPKEDALLPLGRWVTPPYTPVRYDAQYYVAKLPPNQDASIVQGELIHGEFLSMPAALGAHEEGKLQITYPVLETLKAYVDTNYAPKEAQNRLSERENGGYKKPGGELAAGIQIIPLRTSRASASFHINTYCIGTKKLTLIDPTTNIPGEMKKLLKYLHELESEGRKIVSVILTHHPPTASLPCLKYLQRELSLPFHVSPAISRSFKSQIRCSPIAPQLETKLTMDHASPWKILFHSFYENKALSLTNGRFVIAGLWLTPIQHYLKKIGTGFKPDIFQGTEIERVQFAFPAYGPPIASPKLHISTKKDIS